MRKYAILLFICMLSSLIYGQENNSKAQVTSLSQNQMPQVIPPSPQAEVFERYLHHKVTGYNGLPEITIPIYEIKLKGLTIPIYLSYHAGGVKYMQYDGEVGAGWSINVGGYRVDRVVYGNADEEYDYISGSDFQTFIENNAFRGKNIYVDSYLASFCSDRGHMGLIQGKEGDFKFVDGEHDLFTYMLPTTTGNFIINNRANKTVTIAEANQDKIEYTVTKDKNGNSIPQIIIHDGLGNQFILGGDESDQKFIEKNGFGINSSWLLKEIITPYGESVKFKYDFYFIPDTRMRNKQLSISDAKSFILGTTHPGGDQQSFSTELINNPQYSSVGYISEITYNDLSLRFTHENEIATGTEEPYTLGGISIKNGIEQIRTLDLEYFSLPEKSKLSENIQVSTHTLLKKVAIGNNIGNANANSEGNKHIYKFEYYEPSFYETSSQHYYPDMWGYYAGTIPTMSGGALDINLKDNQYVYSKSESGNEDLQSIEFATSGTPLVFVDRYGKSVPDKYPISSFFTLKKITYPTGGTSEYIFEPNQFILDDKTVYGGGHRIKEIISKTDDSSIAKTTRYEYGENGNGIGSIGNIAGSYSNYGFLFADETIDYTLENNWIPARGLYSWMTTNRLFSVNPIFPMFNRYMNVKYDAYSIGQYDGDIPLGKEFNTYLMIDNAYSDEYNLFSSNNSSTIEYGYGNWSLNNYYIGYTPQLTRRAYINQDNDTIKTEIFDYLKIEKAYLEGVRVKQKIFLEVYDYIDRNDPYTYFNSFFNYLITKNHLGSTLLSSKKTITKEVGQPVIEENENYFYDNENRISKVTQTNSNNQNIEKIFTYANAQDHPALVENNMLSTILTTETNNNNIQIGLIKNIYAKNNILPSSVRTSVSGSERTDLTFDRYDSKNNLLQYTTLDGKSTSYLWGYKGLYPIAEIKNATYDQVSSVLGTSPESLSQASEPDMSTVEALRTTLPKAQVTTYTYYPLIGMKTATDPRGQITKYDYDRFGRLNTIYVVEDGRDKVIKGYRYEMPGYTHLKESENTKPKPEPIDPGPDPDPDLTPDPYKKGKPGSVLINIGAKGEGSYGMTGWNYDTQKVEQNNVITKTYKTIEASEYVWTTENLRLKYGSYGSVNMNWVNLTQADVDKYAADYLNGQSIPLEEFEQVFGSWATLYDVAMMYRNIYWGVPTGNGTFDHTWGLPDKEDIWQLYGQAPRTSGNVYEDIKDFLFASACDNKYNWTQNMFNRRNISGLTLTPLGMRESNQGGAIYGFGQVASLQTAEKEKVETLSDRDLSGKSGIISNPYTYHFTQARHRRLLTDEELGYKMYIDQANDQVLMLPHTQVSSLPELPKGMERGIALRYTNREHMKVLKKWSEIQAEATEIKSKLAPTNNPAPPELLPCIPEPEPEVTADPYQKGKEGSVLINIGARGEGSYGMTGWNYDTQKVEQSNVITKTYKTIEASEYVWTTENLRLKYGIYGSVNMIWCNFTQGDVDKFSVDYLGGRSIPLEEFEQVYGSWATLYNEAMMYRNIYWGVPSGGGVFDHTWGLPDKEDIWQLYGQAPRITDNFYNDVKDFLFASPSDFSFGWSQGLFKNKNTSGLTLTPLGMRESYNGGAVYGFGQVTSLQTSVREKVETLSDRDLSGHSGLISMSSTFHFTQARHRRTLTDQELGYKMYIDTANDKVVMLPYDQASTLLELPKGLERGIALRYANRKAMKVVKKWSEIQVEAAEIKSTITQ